MAPKCPKCGSIIYSRRNVLCGLCGERLPAELLFSPEQREAVDKDLKALKERAREMRRSEHDTSSNYGGDIPLGI